MTALDVTSAEARAASARARLNGTVGQLQAELEPHRLARTALAGVTDNGERAARTGVAIARRNPATVAGAAALLVAILARKRIARLLGRNRESPPSPPSTNIAHPAERIGS